MPVNKTIPLHLLDDPEIAMRSEIDDGYIDKLAAEIARDGLINPVAVKKVSDRYVVIAGHCRTIAKRKLGHETIEVRDYTGENINTERIKCRENLGRRDVNDAGIAVYLAEIQEKNHYTMQELEEMTGESEDWINKRLSLFAGDKAVFDALMKGQIKLGHALVLNRFPDEYRAQHLQIVINSTPPVRVVEDFLKQCKLIVMQQTQPQQEAPAPGAATVVPGVVIEGCEICKSSELNWTLVYVRIHKHCLDMIHRSIDDAQKGG